MIRINRKVVTPRSFPDGTFNLTELPSFYGFQDYIIVDWQWEDPSEYMLLYFITSHLHEKYGDCFLSLNMPYIPDARMDRVKDPYKELFTLKYFAKFLNSLKYDEVHVLDPHSHVSAALIDHVVIHQPTEFVKKIVSENNIDVICFPDEGAMKRYGDDINFRTSIYGEKHRDWSTGRINGVIIHNPYDIDLEDKHILIVDDICSKGGTFYHAGKALREFNPSQIDLFVSHCEQSIFDGMLLKPGSDSPILNIYTTNSLKREDNPRIHATNIFEQED